MDQLKDIDPEAGPAKLEAVASHGLGATMTTVHTSTQRGLKSRHGQMYVTPRSLRGRCIELTRRAFRIALGGTIGTGLFVGSGQALAYVAPDSSCTVC